MCWLIQLLDQPTLVNFFCIFEKNYNDWIKSFSKSKWTGLYNCLTQGGARTRTRGYETKHSRPRLKTEKTLES